MLIVLEEAHRYLNEDANSLSREAVNRIAREGRKYGVGLFLVTQRPSELPDTALAQCGTLIALRLTNSSDQGKIKAALPDNIAGLAEVLPSLRTGEALISGEALVLPARALVDRPDPEPMAEDPSLAAWREDPRLPDVTSVLASCEAPGRATMLEWVELDSSFIAAAAYDADAETIYLRFDDGAEWAYEYCSQDEFEQLIDPEQSAGKFFHQVLKGRPQNKVN